MIELLRAATFFASLLSLYWTALAAFFVPNIRWQDRLLELLAKLALSAALCLLSALIFRLPTGAPPNAHADPDASPSLTSTLPLQLFFWAAPLLLALFLTSWYLTCGAPTLTNPYPGCT